jgi:hypothetical protein
MFLLLTQQKIIMKRIKQKKKQPKAIPIIAPADRADEV